MTVDEALNRLLRPAMEEAAEVLSTGEPAAADRLRLADNLATASETVQCELGEEAREPRVHRIIGASASAAMALALGQGSERPAELSAARIFERLREGLDLMSARPWSPEDQGRA